MPENGVVVIRIEHTLLSASSRSLETKCTGSQSYDFFELELLRMPEQRSYLLSVLAMVELQMAINLTTFCPTSVETVLNLLLLHLLCGHK